MTRERAKELLPIIQAFAEGKAVEWRWPGDTWHDATVISIQGTYEYRIKPEPREWWIERAPGGAFITWQIGSKPLLRDPHNELIHVREVV